jgi:hypothetical protein
LGPCLAETLAAGYIVGVSCLTQREWRVIVTVIGLLALGLTVKLCRTAQAAPTKAEASGPPAAAVIPPGRP